MVFFFGNEKTGLGLRALFRSPGLKIQHLPSNPLGEAGSDTVLILEQHRAQVCPVQSPMLYGATRKESTQIGWPWSWR